MKTRNIFIALMALIIIGHIIFDIYFYYQFLIPLENKTKGFWMNRQSFVVNSWTGNGKRLVNENNGKRSRTFQDVFFNDSISNNDSLVKFRDFNGEMGYVNSSTMKVDIPASFHYVTDFSTTGLALAIKNRDDSCYGFINRTGNFQINPSPLLQVKFAFGDDKDIDFTPRFYNDFCSIPVKNGFTLIDKQGNQISNIYDSILTVDNKKHIFASKFKNSWGAIRYDYCQDYYIRFIPHKFKSKKEVYKEYISKKNRKKEV